MKYGIRLQLQLWDTSGLERFHSLSANYYSGASAVIVCYSVVDQLSLSSAAQYIIEAMDNAGRCSSSCGVCPLVFLCGNKSDLQQLQQSATAAPPGADGARRLIDEYSPIVNRSFVVSSLTGAGVADMFAEIAQTIANRGREKADREATTVCQLRSFLSIGDDKSQSKDCSCG
jgi:GTPase SAR1 family protein